MADVTISYKGSNIVELDDSATKTLTTSGKYCEGDITIDYVKPSSPSPKQELWEGVNFIDFDGTIVETWTPQETASKTELPTTPEHQFLTPDVNIGTSISGWNWTLQAIKDYMASNPDACLYVGTQYATVDNATYLFVELTEFTLNPYVSFSVNGTAIIDWGDGSSTTVTGSSTAANARINTQHNYSQTGKYVIKISSATTIYISHQTSGGNISTIFWNNVDYNGSIKYNNCLYAIYLGNCNVLSLGLYDCFNLTEMVISKSASLGVNLTQNNKIDVFIFPSSITGISEITLSSLCYTKLSVPYNITYIRLQSTCHIKALSVPNTCTNVAVYNSNKNYWLSKLTIPKNGNLSTFSGYASAYAFFQAYALQKINVPAGISTIPTGTFGYCYSLQEIHFYNTVPPTVTASDAFRNVPATCKIYVPTGYLNDYQTATNYPDPTVYTYIEE